MGSGSRRKYHKIAKKIGVPNIILTGIEKKARMKFPDDDEGFNRCVIETLQAMTEENFGEWSRCVVLDFDEIDEQPGTGNSTRK